MIEILYNLYHIDNSMDKDNFKLIMAVEEWYLFVYIYILILS